MKTDTYVVYHSGFEEIKHPDVHYGRINADFGQGFYLTDDWDFSKRWTVPKMGKSPVINVYELDLQELKVHRFDRDRNWFTYIFNNRRSMKDSIDADVIIGPIANDTLYDTMGIFTGGILSDDEAMELLMVGTNYRQIVLKTERAAEKLKWKGLNGILPEEAARNRDIVKSEEEKYLEEIGRIMERF